MQIRFIVISSAIALTLVGCGHKNTESWQDGMIQYYTPKQAQDEYASWEVTCDNLNDCPESVGQFVYKVDEVSVGVCTAFLVNNGKNLVTNSHCVEEFSVGESCEGKAAIVFPRTKNKNGLRATCGRIVEHTKKGSFSEPDLAVIELKNPIPVNDRKALEIDKSGVADQQILTLYKIDPSGRADGNRLVAAKCRAVQRAFYLPEFVSAKDPTIAMTDCEVIPGNSGSPMLGSDGRVKAVAFGLMKKDQILDGIRQRLAQIAGQGYESVLDSPDLKGKQFNYATNAACLDQVGAGIRLSDCESGSVEERLARAAADEKAERTKVVTAAIQEFGKWAAANSQMVVWQADAKTKGGDIAFSAEPLCVQPIADWGAQYKMKGILAFGRYETVGSETIQAPRYTFQVRYDGSLKRYVEYRRGTQMITMQFNPNEISSGKGGAFQFAKQGESAEPKLSQIIFGNSGTQVKACGQTVSPEQVLQMYQTSGK